MMTRIGKSKKKNRKKKRTLYRVVKDGLLHIKPIFKTDKTSY
jgi:hypothetical protein